MRLTLTAVLRKLSEDHVLWAILGRDFRVIDTCA
jgi:hypothetical protein